MEVFYKLADLGKTDFGVMFSYLEGKENFKLADK